MKQLAVVTMMLMSIFSYGQDKDTSIFSRPIYQNSGYPSFLNGEERSSVEKYYDKKFSIYNDTLRDTLWIDGYSFIWDPVMEAYIAPDLDMPRYPDTATYGTISLDGMMFYLDTLSFGRWFSDEIESKDFEVIEVTSMESNVDKIVICRDIRRILGYSERYNSSSKVFDFEYTTDGNIGNWQLFHVAGGFFSFTDLSIRWYTRAYNELGGNALIAKWQRL